MTQEEKARAYDEALIRGSRLWESDMITRENYEYIFPELKESEDARIRKEMIEILRKEAQDFPSSVIAEKSNSWIAWLEKQDEQKLADKVEPKFKVGQTIKKEGFNLGFTIAKIKGNFYYNDVGDHFPFTDQDNWELVEQNYAWSEEDDRMYNIIVSYIPQHLTAESYTACINWLKSFKDRVQPQPKQEWSEKDRRMLIGLIDELDAIMNKATPNEISVYSKYINWLKSLRPQSTWKPSDEQIIELRRVISGCSYDIEPLVEIEEQLKKLKE